MTNVWVLLGVLSMSKISKVLLSYCFVCWINVNNVLPLLTPQLEDIDVLVADHVQRVHKTNFLASWDEIGDECEMQDTYALTQMTSLEGKYILKHLSSFSSISFAR